MKLAAETLLFYGWRKRRLDEAHQELKDFLDQPPNAYWSRTVYLEHYVEKYILLIEFFDARLLNCRKFFAMPMSKLLDPAIEAPAKEFPLELHTIWAGLLGIGVAYRSPECFAEPTTFGCWKWEGFTVPGGE